MRRREFGRVAADKADKTRRVELERRVADPKYGAATSGDESTYFSRKLKEVATQGGPRRGGGAIRPASRRDDDQGHHRRHRSGRDAALHLGRVGGPDRAGGE